MTVRGFLREVAAARQFSTNWAKHDAPVLTDRLPRGTG
jgi:hypothetical protein